MPTAALRPCLAPGCPVLVQQGRCQAHAAQQEQQRGNVDVRRLYRTARWRRLRAQQFNDDPLCVDCRSEGHTEIWTDLDHEVPHRGDLALFWDSTNLRGRCHPHHSAKTGRGE